MDMSWIEPSFQVLFWVLACYVAAEAMGGSALTSYQTRDKSGS
jgi:hypothetical protein